MSLLFDLSFILPSFPFFVLSFLFHFDCSTVLFVPRSFFLFISWSSRCSNLGITLAITFYWKRNPGRGIDSIDPNKKNSTKKVNRFSTLGHQVVLRLGEPYALLHSYERFFIATMRSHLQFLKLLSGEVWRFLAPWLNKEGQLRGDPFSFS